MTEGLQQPESFQGHGRGDGAEVSTFSKRKEARREHHVPSVRLRPDFQQKNTKEEHILGGSMFQSARDVKIRAAAGWWFMGRHVWVGPKRTSGCIVMETVGNTVRISVLFGK